MPVSSLSGFPALWAGKLLREEIENALLQQAMLLCHWQQHAR